MRALATLSGTLLAASALLLASEASAQPATLITAPVMKPRRRPTRAIHNDSGMVVSAEPST